MILLDFKIACERDFGMKKQLNNTKILVKNIFIEIHLINDITFQCSISRHDDAQIYNVISFRYRMSRLLLMFPIINLSI